MKRILKLFFVAVIVLETIMTAGAFEAQAAQKYAQAVTKVKTYRFTGLEGMQYFGGDVIWVKKNGKWGAVDFKGKETVKSQYAGIGYIGGGIVCVYTAGNKQGLYNVKGKKLTDCKYDLIDVCFNEDWNLIGVSKEGGRHGMLDGCVNTKGEEVVKCKYEQIALFDENGLASFSEGGDKWGYLNTKGEAVNKNIEECDPLPSEGMYIIKKNGKTGFMNAKGKEITKFKYQDARSFHEGLAAVKRGGKWGYIDTTGKEVIKVQYQQAGDFSEGIARIKNGGKWGYINTRDGEVAGCMYKDATDFHDGVAAVKLYGNWGFINSEGEEITDFVYYSADNFYNNDEYSKGITCVIRNGGIGAVNTKGEEFIECIYSELMYIGDGYFLAEKDGERYSISSTGKWGCLNLKGEEVVPFEYSTVNTNAYFESEPFCLSCGLLRMNRNGKWGYVNMKGEEVVPCKYSRAFNFYEGCAIVAAGRGYGLIDVTGKEIVKTGAYSDIKPFVNGLARATKLRKIAYINTNGKEVVSRQFTAGDYDFENGWAVVNDDECYCLIIEDGYKEQ